MEQGNNKIDFLLQEERKIRQMRKEVSSKPNQTLEDRKLLNEYDAELREILYRKNFAH